MQTQQVELTGELYRLLSVVTFTESFQPQDVCLLWGLARNVCSVPWRYGSLSRSILRFHSTWARGKPSRSVRSPYRSTYWPRKRRKWLQSSLHFRGRKVSVRRLRWELYGFGLRHHNIAGLSIELRRSRKSARVQSLQLVHLGSNRLQDFPQLRAVRRRGRSIE